MVLEKHAVFVFVCTSWYGLAILKKFQCLNEQISYIHVFNEGFLSTVLKSAFLNEYIQQQFVFVLF